MLRPAERLALGEALGMTKPAGRLPSRSNMVPKSTGWGVLRRAAPHPQHARPQCAPPLCTPPGGAQGVHIRLFHAHIAENATEVNQVSDPMRNVSAVVHAGPCRKRVRRQCAPPPAAHTWCAHDILSHRHDAIETGPNRLALPLAGSRHATFADGAFVMAANHGSRIFSVPAGMTGPRRCRWCGMPRAQALLPSSRPLPTRIAQLSPSSVPAMQSSTTSTTKPALPSTRTSIDGHTGIWPMSTG